MRLRSQVMVITVTAVVVLLGTLGTGSAAAAVSAVAVSAVAESAAVPDATLAAAVACDPALTPQSGHRAVLLVHGTGSTPEEAWAWNYARTLPAAGFAVCTVRLPDRANGAFTDSVEYVAYAAAEAARRSGGDIAMVGHSQGGVIAAWAATFLPQVARVTGDVITLASPLNGTAVANTLCAGGACSPLSWQLARGSNAISALQSASRTGGPAYTSVATLQDELVLPQPSASTLPGARTILLQQVCAVRVTEHGTILADAVAHALVLDALRNPGPADPARVSRAVCLQGTTPGVDLVGAAPFYRTVTSLGVGLINVREWVTEEPALPDYARVD